LDHQNPHGGMKNIEDVAAEHDVESNKSLMTQFFPAAYTCLRDKGFLITWCDQMLWQFMYDLAITAGFRVQRWPLTWVKTSSCMNQMANVNFTKNTEIAIVCRKGTANLTKPQTSSVWTGGNDLETKMLGHPFVKPAPLWTWLYEAVAHKGSTVLDPFAGVGSSTIPAIRFGLTPLTCEINEDHYNRQVINVQNQFLALNPNVKFQ
jgi:adenine-specific DNA methylase